MMYGRPATNNNDSPPVPPPVVFLYAMFDFAKMHVRLPNRYQLQLHGDSAFPYQKKILVTTINLLFLLFRIFYCFYCSYRSAFINQRFPGCYVFFTWNSGNSNRFFWPFYRSAFINQRFPGFWLIFGKTLEPLKNKDGTVGTVKNAFSAK